MGWRAARWLRLALLATAVAAAFQTRGGGGAGRGRFRRRRGLGLRSQAQGDNMNNMNNVGSVGNADAGAGERDRFDVRYLEEDLLAGRPVLEAAERLAKERGEPPPMAEVARGLGIGEAEARELAERARRAQTEILRKNLPLAMKFVRDFRGNGGSGARGGPAQFPTQDDLLNEAVLGLGVAARKFDPSKGAKYNSYATWWVRDQVQGASRRSSRMIPLPQRASRELTRLLQARGELRAELQRAPTVGEIAARSGLSEKKVETLESVRWDTRFADEEELLAAEAVAEAGAGVGAGVDIGVDVGVAVGVDVDVGIGPEGKTAAELYPTHPVEEIIRDKLTPEEQAMLCCTFGLPWRWNGRGSPKDVLRGPRKLPYKDVAAMLGVSHSRVVEVMRVALRKLRESAELRGIV